MEGDLVIRTGQPRTVRECLAEAQKATSPAAVVQCLFLALSYQQQQIEQLELMVGIEDEAAAAGVRARARRSQHEDRV